jgi:alpha-glucosidase
MAKNLILTRAASGASDRRNQLLSSCLVASLLALSALPALAQSPGAASQTQAKTFIDYFLPTLPHGELSRDAWGAPNVIPRDPKNGLEDTTIKQYCYWDGQIIKASDGKYHIFASRWPESRGHGGWGGSVAVHAVSDSLMGPYEDKGLCWPNDAGGQGHNVGALTMPDGRYAVYVSETRPTEVYVSKSLDGPWEHLGTITVEDNPRWHGSNVSLMVRPDGNFEFTQRDGSIYTSDKGILGPYKRQSGSVYPRGIPNLEDPCIWYSGGLYHILVNSWSTRKAYHLTSTDGIHDWTNRGLAYDPRESIVRYPNGTVNHWNKVERPAVYIENGHVVAMTLAAIDVEKEQDRGGDGHGSKVIVIPFDGAALDRDLQATSGTTAAAVATPSASTETATQSASEALTQPAPKSGSTYRVASPNGTIHAEVKADKELSYSVQLDGKPLIVPSRLGLDFDVGLKLGQNVQAVDASTSEHNETWKDDFGKFSTVKDNYRELRVHLREVRASPSPPVDFALLVRAYNDGVALRYVLLKQEPLGKFRLTEDSTQFLFESDCRAWVGDNTGYETPFPETRLSRMSNRPKSLPLVAEQSNAYVAVAEADVRDWAGCSLVDAGVQGAFGVRALLISPVDSETPRTSPWHALIVTRKAGDLTVSTLLRNLATPSQIADTSWIQPGISAWDAWWTGVNPYWDQYKGVQARGNTRSHKDWIDLAAEMGWTYMLIDWYWYNQDSRDPETAIKPEPHIDMPELMSYAKAKGVKLILWCNSKNIDSIGMEKLFATYAGWGASGVKIDFFPRLGSQVSQRWQEELLACAAKHKLVLDFHGIYTPTGLSRTWPNLITQEGVLGEEYAKLGRQFSSAHMMALPFTRGLLGPADVTPGGFVNVREDQFRPNAIPTQVVGTRARQLALSVLMDSPYLCLCDSPTNYRGQPGIEFYRGLPTTWNETRALDAKAMEHLVQARRKGNGWWLAAMNKQEPLTLSVKLDFLSPGNYVLRSFADTPESSERPAAIAESTRTVTAKDTLEIHMETAGGYVAAIEPSGTP